MINNNPKINITLEQMTIDDIDIIRLSLNMAQVPLKKVRNRQDTILRNQMKQLEIIFEQIEHDLKSKIINNAYKEIEKHV